MNIGNHERVDEYPVPSHYETEDDYREAVRSINPYYD